MTKTEEFDKRLEKTGFNYAERERIKLISKEAGLEFVELDPSSYDQYQGIKLEEIDV